MEIVWLRLIAALAISELVHNLFEVWGMRQKVKWLRLSMDSKPHGKWPINVNTNLKVWALHIGMLVGITAMFYGLFSLLDLSNYSLAAVTISTLLACYFIVVFKVHKFHNEIGALIKDAKDKII